VRELEIGTSDLVQVGEHRGEKKRRPEELSEEGEHLLAIIRAQAVHRVRLDPQHAATLGARDRRPGPGYWCCA